MIWGVKIDTGFIVRVVLTYLRLYLGAWMLINGLNHWLPIFPQPFGTDPKSQLFLTTLVDTDLFAFAKAVEVLGGALLIMGWFTPLALALLLPVSAMVYFNDAYLQNRYFRFFYMGTGCLEINLILIVAYFRYYLPMLSFHATMGHINDLKKLPTIFRESL